MADSNSELVRAYKDVFGSAGRQVNKSDAEIAEHLKNHSVIHKNQAMVLANKEMSADYKPAEPEKDEPPTSERMQAVRDRADQRRETAKK